MTNKGIREIPLFDPILPKMDCPLFGVQILKSFRSWLPLTTYGILSIVGALCTFFLPELGTVPMFTTVAEGERFYSKVSFQVFW